MMPDALFEPIFIVAAFHCHVARSLQPIYTINMS